MPTRTHTLLCLSAVFGLPFLIVGCADAIVEESATTDTEAGVSAETAANTGEKAEAESTGIERLVVKADGTIGHEAVDFQEAIASKDGIILVDFWATWCPPCRLLAPELEQLATENPDKVTIIKVDVDIASEIAASYEVSSIPDVRVFKAGEQIDTMVGFQKADAIAKQLGL